MTSSRPSTSRDITAIQSAKHLQGSRRHHDRNVRGRAFSTGDLVLRKVQKRKHKLSAIREGPYIISELTRPGTYMLKHEYQLSVHVVPFINFVLLTLCSLGNPTKQRVPEGLQQLYRYPFAFSLPLAKVPEWHTSRPEKRCLCDVYLHPRAYTAHAHG